MCSRGMRGATLVLQLVAATAVLVGRAAGDPGDVVTRLPGPVVDYAMADSGRKLVLRIEGESALHVYDTGERKLTGTLDLPTSGFAFGAGGDRIVVFLTEENRFRTYDLETLEPLKEQGFIDPVVVTNVVMGAARGDQALIRISGGTQALDRTSLRLLNTADLSLVSAAGPNQATGHNMSYRDVVHFRPDAHLTRVAEWCTSHSPSGIGVLYRVGDRFEHSYDHSSAGYLVMGDDGNIYTGSGQIMDVMPVEQRQQPFRAMRELGRVEGRSLIPGLGGRFYLGIAIDGSMALYPVGKTRPISDVGAFPGWQLPAQPNGRPSAPPQQNVPPGMVQQFGDSRITLDKRIVFAPDQGFILFLSPSGEQLMQRPFDLEEVLDRTRRNYMYVVSSPPVRAAAGETWTYQVRALVRDKPFGYRFERAPDGMELSEDGVLRWEVPGGIEGKAPVVVVIEDNQGKTIRHAFEVQFE